VRGVSLVVDREFVRLWDLGDWWCIEDKVLTRDPQRFPIVYRGSTRTVLQMYIEFTKLGNSLVPVRVYMPKNVPLEKVLRSVDSWNEEWIRKYEEARPLLEVNPGGPST
jgi:hypothetical protein